jgi:hypothetical protein
VPRSIRPLSRVATWSGPRVRVCGSIFVFVGVEGAEATFPRRATGRRSPVTQVRMREQWSVLVADGRKVAKA